MNPTTTSDPIAVHVHGDLTEAVLLAHAAGANLGDLEYDDRSIVGVTILRARTPDGAYAIKTLLETGHAAPPWELFHAPTIPHPPPMGT